MMRTRRRSRAVASLLAWAASLAIAFPLLWALLTSFKTELEAVSFPPRILSFDWTLANYRGILAGGDYLHSLINSVLIAGGSSTLVIAVAVPAAWSMAFAPTRRTRGILMWMLSTKMLPPVGVFIPVFLFYRDWGLLDSRAGLVVLLAAANLPIAVWMLFSNFRDVPGEILEAARMDGASLWQELVSVLAPLALPGIASTFFLVFTLAWNESFWSLNLVTTEATPLTAFIAAFSSPQGLFWARLSAASILSIVPVLLIGWLCQRQLVRGLTFGAVK
ncbi:MAG TPA: carbohydrate ABC transporter permease [Sphingopyxis sp.]|uniref:carbohydrate ABC transporter permease n=1 Tax=Sphingopyxis sp. TaxID=1908224 RepID=UPI002C43EABD|nr:carbohydrate ABC transporter permease [Sphingopyxis sp.]HWW56295.1 carbohydrate ABC transporter permease [Sphingopyxis sp.]